MNNGEWIAQDDILREGQQDKIISFFNSKKHKYGWSNPSIPDWVEWIATDESGDINGYVEKPIQENDSNQWATGYHYCPLFINRNNSLYWTDSLEQRPDEFRKPKPDPNTESLLHECCLALGWSGGTRAQVLQVLRSAKKFLVETAKNENSGYVKAYQELKQLIG